MAIILDPQCDPAFSAPDFDPSAWLAAGAEVLAGGRGGSLLIQRDEQRYVLRRYLRGGMLARLGLARDRYPWSGLARSRPARERALVDFARRAELPVPAVRGYVLQRAGLLYRAAIISDYVVNQGTLAAVIARDELRDGDWQRLGATVRRFHALGIDHADLNAANILLTTGGEFVLIDFDKARLHRGAGAWQERNLARLARSLHKFAAARLAAGQPFHFSDRAWSALREGYRNPASKAR